jgi:hypothetical protein
MTNADPKPQGKSDEQRRREWDEQDREVADISRTVQSGKDPKSRTGITGPGSGADAQES